MAALTSRRSVENWQTGKTVEECNLRMLTSEVACDITLLIGGDGQLVNAHRFVLISRSCVFAAIFSDLKDEADLLAIADVEPDDFHDFLVYLYTNATDIGPENATGLLYAARKYGVGGLEDACADYLRKHLSYKNACRVLEAAHQANHHKLYKRALRVVLEHGNKCLRSPAFLNLSNKCVEDVVKSDDLAADETVVFDAVNSWAEAECGRRQMEPTPRNKRDMLGQALKCVRFTLMESKFFVDTVGNSGLLADDERLKIFAHNLLPEKDISPFNKNERTGRRASSQDSSTTTRSTGSSSYRDSRSSQQMSPPEVRDKLDSRSSVGMTGNGHGPDRYRKYERRMRERRSIEEEDSSASESGYEQNVARSHRKPEKHPVYNRTENRFRVQSFGRNCSGKEWETIRFRCREKIQLCGFLLFGPCDVDVATYSVQAFLCDDVNARVAGTNIDARYTAKKEEVIFEVTFSSFVHLAPQKWYTLNVQIRGSPSMYGSDVKDRVVSHGVTFEFQHSESRAYRSEQGQVPYLLFR